MEITLHFLLLQGLQTIFAYNCQPENCEGTYCCTSADQCSGSVSNCERPYCSSNCENGCCVGHRCGSKNECNSGGGFNFLIWIFGGFIVIIIFYAIFKCWRARKTIRPQLNNVPSNANSRIVQGVAVAPINEVEMEPFQSSALPLNSPPSTGLEFKRTVIIPEQEKIPYGN